MSGTESFQLTVIRLAQPPVAKAELWRLLTPDELTRAARFRFPHLQENFKTGRGMLRSILSAATGIAGNKLEFANSSHGKPSIASQPAPHFNVSHSADLWACVTGPSVVGLDIEHVRPLTDREDIGKRFFSPEECAAMETMPESERLSAFYRCWTRKEAYLKALGDGLSRGLATFTVDCADRELSRVHDKLSPERWHIRAFVPEPGYAGAIATRESSLVRRSLSAA